MLTEKCGCDNLGDSSDALLRHSGLDRRGWAREIPLPGPVARPHQNFLVHHPPPRSWLAGQHPPLQSDKRPQTWTDYSGFWMLIPQKETRGLRSCSRTCFELNVTTFAPTNVTTSPHNVPMLPAHLHLLHKCYNPPPYLNGSQTWTRRLNWAWNQFDLGFLQQRKGKRLELS